MEQTFTCCNMILLFLVLKNNTAFLASFRPFYVTFLIPFLVVSGGEPGVVELPEWEIAEIIDNREGPQADDDGEEDEHEDPVARERSRQLVFPPNREIGHIGLRLHNGGLQLVGFEVAGQSSRNIASIPASGGGDAGGQQRQHHRASSPGTVVDVSPGVAAAFSSGRPFTPQPLMR